METILLKKMPTFFKNPVEYWLDVGERLMSVNDLIGRKINLKHIGYQCLFCGKEKEIFRQGACKKCFFESPSTADWIMHPELSKAHLDIEDRDLAYEKSVQIQPHIVYLANSSQVKVGVTRKTQIPTRWIDQGAHKALPIVEVPNRYLAGICEVALKEFISDKTSWRKMLTNDIEEVDLQSIKLGLQNFIPEEVKPYILENPEEFSINFPVEEYPTKVNSLNLLKTPEFSGILKGIKAQYLIFEGGVVFNVRSHEGFKILLDF